MTPEIEQAVLTLKDAISRKHIATQQSEAAINQAAQDVEAADSALRALLEPTPNPQTSTQ